MSHGWQLFTRNQFAEATGGIPAFDAEAVVRRIATGKFVTESPFTPDRWRRLAPSCGLIIRRRGQTILSGVWTRRAYHGATAEFPLGTIALEGVSDDVIAQYRLAVPDPTRALDLQNTTAVWSRGPAPIETVMHMVVNENAGPGAIAARRVPGLVLGADLGRGPVVTWKSLRFATVQEELQRMAAYSEARGVRLLPRFGQTELGLTFDVLEADDKTGRVVFGPGLGNLADVEYAETSGDTGTAVAAGSGVGAARLAKMVVTADAFTLAFGVRPEVFVDRRETDDVAELLKAAQEEVDRGVAGVEFSGAALDTPGTRWGVDFDLNSLASVRIAPPGIDPATGRQYDAIASFDDLVREVAFKLDADSQTDRVTAAVGKEGAETGVPLPSLKALAALKAKVARLERGL